jgi:hypothetical protein
MVGHALLTQSDTDGPVTIAEKKGKAYCRLSFYRWEGGYDITDYYRVLIGSQGAFGLHRLISILLLALLSHAILRRRGSQLTYPT